MHCVVFRCRYRYQTQNSRDYPRDYYYSRDYPNIIIIIIIVTIIIIILISVLEMILMIDE